jgi:FG-GAP-like repeat
VLIGNGDGTFQAPVSYPAGDNSFSVAVGDFNTDGKLDLIVTAPSSDGKTVNLLLGKGDGTFQTPMPYTVGMGPVGVAAADLNSDGLLDVVVANQFSGDVSVLLNSGQPCRAAPVIDHLRARPDALWPSGRLVDVFIDYQATSECGGSPACTLAVGSNEPATQKDYRIVDAHHLKLRAEVSDREERGESDRGERKHSDQLVYQIQVSCTDRLGNVTHGHTIVTVLKDHHGHRDEDHRKYHDLDPASEEEEDSGSRP